MSKIRLNVANLQWLERAEDFVELYKFPKPLLEDVVRAPEEIKVDPTSGEKGYKILQFRRGDITVVVGLRDPETPSVLHVWLHGVEEGDQHHTGKAPGYAGGGGKNPKSPQQLRGWLQSEGCTLQHNGRGHYNVYWRDILIGGIGSTMKAQAVLNDYSFIRRRLAAERAKASLTEE